jgi:hypothetical protein
MDGQNNPQHNPQHNPEHTIISIKSKLDILHGLLTTIKNEIDINEKILLDIFSDLNNKSI